MQTLFLIGRIILGGYFLESGYNHFANVNSLAGYAASKGVPAAKMMTIVTGAMLALGGVSIMLGVYPRIGMTLVILFLLSTLVKMHTYWKNTDPMQRMGERINFYKNLALIGALLMLMSIPLPWMLSI